MRKRKKYLLRLAPAFVSLVLFSSLIIFLSPDQSFSFFNFSVPTKPIFFILLFSAFTFMGSFVFLSYKRGALLGFLIVSILILRYFDFTSLFYPLLLLLLIILIDRLIKK